ncbi:MAG: hypothetical protein HYZ13_08885 [Acidobacteria bacterium]|nr:hypothetical protein [Acidobacteriota bacterium]
MLDPDRFTREDLYEAIWPEAVQKVAQALGISDVGLAKICKKLNVPRPSRGYWAKSPTLRKVLKKPLPPLAEGQTSVSSISQAGVAGWTREALKSLAEEGIAAPTAATNSNTKGPHPLIAKYASLVAEKEWGVRTLVKEKPCLALAVSKPALERGMAIFQTIFETLEARGFTPEILPPQRATNSYGYAYDAPGRTGVRIKGAFVSFELREETRSIEIPPPPPPPPSKGRRPSLPDFPPRSTWRTEGTGLLTLEIPDPDSYGLRKRWKDGTKKVEAQLEGFFKGLLAIAELAYEREQERQEQKRAEMEREQARLKAEAIRAELAERMYDLESRLMDVQQAEAIRAFARKVRFDAEAREVPLEPGIDLAEWLAWAEGLAQKLEQGAVQTVLSQRRHPPVPKPTYGYQASETAEAHLRNEVDLWRRRYIYGRPRG